MIDAQIGWIEGGGGDEPDRRDRSVPPTINVTFNNQAGTTVGGQAVGAEDVGHHGWPG